MGPRCAPEDGPYGILRDDLIKRHRVDWTRAWRAAGSPGIVQAFLNTQARAAWEAMSLEERRQMVRPLLAARGQAAAPAHPAAAPARLTAAPASLAAAVADAAPVEEVSTAGRKRRDAAATLVRERSQAPARKRPAAPARATACVSDAEPTGAAVGTPATPGEDDALSIVSSVAFASGAASVVTAAPASEVMASAEHAVHADGPLSVAASARGFAAVAAPLVSRARSHRSLRGSAAASSVWSSLSTRRRLHGKQVDPETEEGGRLRVFQTLAGNGWISMPGDLSDWLQRYPRLEAEFEPCPGVLLLLANLKLSPLRQAFLQVWRAGVASTGVSVGLLCKALAAASAVVVAGRTLSMHGLPDTTGYSAWQLQCNSTTSYHHGSIAFLRRWGLIAGGSRSDPSPLRVMASSAELETALQRVLSPAAARFVQGLRAASTLEDWVVQVESASKDLCALGLPGAASDGEQ